MENRSIKFLNKERFIEKKIKKFDMLLAQTIVTEDYENANKIYKKISRLKIGKLSTDDLLELQQDINKTIRKAVRDWLDDPVLAEAEYGHISGWDTSEVTDMNLMFYGAKYFNQPLDNWDVSNVTNMYKMFQDASSFNQPLDNWDVSNVTCMDSMFEDASSFNQPLDKWDVSSVTSLKCMFTHASSFNQPLDNWDTSEVTDMSLMFYGAKYFNQPLDNWDVSKVTSMNAMFDGASSFNQPLDNWDVSSVTSMDSMFEDASSFNQPLDNWDVSSVTSMGYMFQDASTFNQPLDNWDVSSVTYMGSMFKSASTFNQPLDNWDVSNVTNMCDMFRGAKSFCQDISNWKLSRNREAMFIGARAFNKVYDINGKARKKISINSTQRKKILKVKKLFEGRDYSLFDSGIHLISSFNEIVFYEFFLNEIKISKDGNFVRSKYFSGSGPAQPSLDYILLSLINDAPTKAKIHCSIKRASIKCIYLEAQRPYLAGTCYTENCGKYSAHQLPDLAFENLEEITLDNYTNLESLKFLLNCKKLKKIVLKGCNNIKDTQLFKKQILIDLRYFTVAKLKEMAKAKGIEGLSSMKKADLIATLSSYYTIKDYYMKLH